MLAAGDDALVGELPALVAGSWVYGDLTTWIGHADKNRAWELLVDAKRAVDEAIAAGRVDTRTQARISRLLASCESSDWFWWFGDYHPAESVASFDRLFRASLAHLYALIGTAAPAALAQPVSLGSTASAQQGAILRANAP